MANNLTSMVRLLRAVIINNEIYCPGSAIPVPTFALFGDRERAIIDILGSDLVRQIDETDYQIVGDVVVDLDDISIYKRDYIRLDPDIAKNPDKPIAFSIDPVGVIEFSSSMPKLGVTIEDKILVQGSEGILAMTLTIGGKPVTDAVFSKLPAGISVVKTNGAQGKYNFVVAPDWEGVSKTYTLTMDSALLGGPYSFIVKASYRKAIISLDAPALTMFRNDTKTVDFGVQVESKDTNVDNPTFTPDGTHVKESTAVPNGKRFNLTVKTKSSPVGNGYVHVTGATNPGALPIDARYQVIVREDAVFTLSVPSLSIPSDTSGEFTFQILRDGIPIAITPTVSSQGQNRLVTVTRAIELSGTTLTLALMSAKTSGDDALRLTFQDTTQTPAKDITLDLPVTVTAAPVYTVTRSGNFEAPINGTAGVGFKVLKDGLFDGNIVALAVQPEDDTFTAATKPTLQGDVWTTELTAAGVEKSGSYAIRIQDGNIQAIRSLTAQAVDNRPFTIVPVSNKVPEGQAADVTFRIERDGVVPGAKLTEVAVVKKDPQVTTAGAVTGSNPYTVSLTGGTAGSVDLALTFKYNGRLFEQTLPVVIEARDPVLTVTLDPASVAPNGNGTVHFTVLADGKPLTSMQTPKTVTPDGTLIKTASVDVAAAPFSLTYTSGEVGLGSVTLGGLALVAGGKEYTLKIDVPIVAPFVYELVPLDDANTKVIPGQQLNLDFYITRNGTKCTTMERNDAQPDGTHVVSLPGYANLADNAFRQEIKAGTPGQGSVQYVYYDTETKISAPVALPVTVIDPTYTVEVTNHQLEANSTTDVPFVIKENGTDITSGVTALVVNTPTGGITQVTLKSSGVATVTTTSTPAESSFTVAFTRFGLPKTIQVPMTVTPAASYTVEVLTAQVKGYQQPGSAATKNEALPVGFTLKKNGVAMGDLTAMNPVMTPKSANVTVADSMLTAESKGMMVYTGAPGSAIVELSFNDGGPRKVNIQFTIIEPTYQISYLDGTVTRCYADNITYSLLKNGVPWNDGQLGEVIGDNNLLHIDLNYGKSLVNGVVTIVAASTSGVEGGSSNVVIQVTDTVTQVMHPMEVQVTVVAPTILAVADTSPALGFGNKVDIPFTIKKDGKAADITVSNWGVTGPLGTYNGVVKGSGTGRYTLAQAGLYATDSDKWITILGTNPVFEGKPLPIPGTDPRLRLVIPYYCGMTLTQVGTLNGSETQDLIFTLRTPAGPVTEAYFSKFDIASSSHSPVDSWSNAMRVVDAAAGKYAIRVTTNHMGGDFSVTLRINSGRYQYQCAPTVCTSQVTPVVVSEVTGGDAGTGAQTKITFTLKQAGSNNPDRPFVASGFKDIVATGAISATNLTKVDDQGHYSLIITGNGAAGNATVTFKATVDENPGMYSQDYPISLTIPMTKLFDYEIVRDDTVLLARAADIPINRVLGIFNKGKLVTATFKSTGQLPPEVVSVGDFTQDPTSKKMALTFVLKGSYAGEAKILSIPLIFTDSATSKDFQVNVKFTIVPWITNGTGARLYPVAGAPIHGNITAFSPNKVHDARVLWINQTGQFNPSSLTVGGDGSYVKSTQQNGEHALRITTGIPGDGIITFRYLDQQNNPKVLPVSYTILGTYTYDSLPGMEILF